MIRRCSRADGQFDVDELALYLERLLRDQLSDSQNG
jgi:hypothetical protein